jgi:glycosyltransferase involved in cell wall biosynthesis
MTRVLLLHGGLVPHYRVAIYGHLRRYLQRYGFDMSVLAEGIQADNPHTIDFPFTSTSLSALNIGRHVYREKIDVVILFVDMRHLYLFPTYFIVKGLMRRRLVWWGQGRDLADRDAKLKNLAYASEHALCDSIILYAEHLKKYLPAPFHHKIFVANNTLLLTYQGLPEHDRGRVLTRHGIHTSKNIICVGRIQKRKRLDRLIAAVALMNRPDVGVILVGPDPEGVLSQLVGNNVFKLGALYGDEKFDLLSAADVYCLPGAVGLSIVDAFYCGLPFVTEEGDESAEITYLKNGENGFVVPRGDIAQLAEKLLLLLDDEERRKQFSQAAKAEIAGRGHIDRMSEGFRDALCYATKRAHE